MAFPLLPIAAMLMGSLASNEANKQVEQERNNKMLAERMRQQALAKEAQARLNQSLETQSRPNMEQEARVSASKREAKYEQAAPKDAAYITNPSAPTEVKSEMAARLVDALQRGRQQSAALAKLGGRADANFTGAQDIGRGGQELNRIGTASRMSSGIIPYEMAAANQKGQGMRTMADLFNLYGTYGLFSGMAAAPTPAQQLAGGVIPM